jgi:predicted Rossmann-fold nucleotide-binding protein
MAENQEKVPNLSVDALFSQKGKVVVVTGGGTGLGLMMATAFVQNGAKSE